MDTKPTTLHIAVLGLGEAGSRFANDLAGLGVTVTAWDPNPRYPLHPDVQFCASNPAACKGADLIWSVNLSQVSGDVAREVAPNLEPGQVFGEMNTTSPEAKKQAEKILAGSGALFADVAIMAPVPPKGIYTPLWVSGPGARAFAEKSALAGLTVQVLGPETGAASTRKLLRSIVYKGLAAVIGEATQAAEALGLETYIREQIREVTGLSDDLTDRFLEGSRTHALRRSHEMAAVADMLRHLGLEPVMTDATRLSLERLIPPST